MTELIPSILIRYCHSTFILKYDIIRYVCIINMSLTKLIGRGAHKAIQLYRLYRRHFEFANWMKFLCLLFERPLTIFNTLAVLRTHNPNPRLSFTTFFSGSSPKDSINALHCSVQCSRIFAMYIFL